MAYYSDIWRIINSSHSSTKRYAKKGRQVCDSRTFNGLPIRAQNEINAIIENEQRDQYTKLCGGHIATLDSVRDRSEALKSRVINCFVSGKPLAQPVRDAIMNYATGANVHGVDPSTSAVSVPNLYISPAEAATIYSQKGLPETILQKKSQSILLNGVKIKNPKFTPEQYDDVQLSVLKHGTDKAVADSVRDGLGFGGALMYPVFKDDSPLSMGLPISALIKYGIIGKGKLDRFVTLDRWNTVHIPNWNPTAADFLTPKFYYIPYLGAEINGERCARIVPCPQLGYWGAVATMGWGISDIVGWIESVYNYYNIMSIIPSMINQMSLLVRTFNVDGILATEGSNILNDIDLENTLKIRDASVLNPVNMDVIGDVKAIDRDFAEVANLTRLVRQDVGCKANIPEELLWSSERGAFSSGDSTEGALEKQWESVKYIHKGDAAQLKRVAMLHVIDALGLDRDVMKILPYTTIEFDNPIIANAEARAKIADLLGKCAFNLVAAGVPADASMQIVSSYGNDEFNVRSDLIESLKTRQLDIDKRGKEKHDREMKLLEAQIESAKNSEGGTGLPSSPKSDGYTRLEQREKEKTRGTEARHESMQKAQGRKL
jgi:hypothetical protein